MQLDELVSYLDGYLRIAEVPDYPGAWNGLQVGSPAEVRRIAVAVDASLPAIESAAGAGADLLIVHHGLFWGADPRLVDVAYARISILLEHGIAVYASHLPLDAHAEVGNAAVLTRRLGLASPRPFAHHEGVALGLRGELSTTRTELASRLEAILGRRVEVIPGGNEEIRSVGVVTGGGGAFVAEAAAAGVEALVTGEAAHHQAVEARERGVSLLLGGHHATETWGVCALAQHLEDRFGLPWVYLDHPSGL